MRINRVSSSTTIRTGTSSRSKSWTPRRGLPRRAGLSSRPWADGGDGAEGRDGGRRVVAKWVAKAPRRDRQGHAAVRLYAGTGADRRVHHNGHGRRAGRAVADPGDRNADA